MISSHWFKPIPKYPAVRRDFALLLDEKVNFGDLFTIARQTEKQLLKDVTLFDVYEGKNLPKGKKSYAVNFIFQDDEKTLKDKQAHDKVDLAKAEELLQTVLNLTESATDTSDNSNTLSDRAGFEKIAERTSDQSTNKKGKLLFFYNEFINTKDRVNN